MTPENGRPALTRQAPTLDPAQKKSLRAQAHHLDPVVIIGDSGLSESVIAETDRALSAHGLIKIRVHGDDRDQRLACLREICERLGCAPVQTIGKLLVVWRPVPPKTGGGDAGLARKAGARSTKKAIGARRDSASARPVTRSEPRGSGTRARRRAP
jgi:RNA-binding protein